MGGRSKRSPWRYDRATIRFVLEREGRDAALARWPKEVVDPIARVLGLTKPWKRMATALTQEQVGVLGTKPDGVLAGEWDIPLSTVVKTRVLLGILPVGHQWRVQQKLARVRALTDAQLREPILAAAAACGLGPQLLAAERRRRGIRPLRGDRYRPALNDRRCVAIRALRAAYPGITLEELGEVFNVTRERIRQITELESLYDNERTA